MSPGVTGSFLENRYAVGSMGSTRVRTPTAPRERTHPKAHLCEGSYSPAPRDLASCSHMKKSGENGPPMARRDAPGEQVKGAQNGVGLTCKALSGQTQRPFGRILVQAIKMSPSLEIKNARFPSREIPR